MRYLIMLLLIALLALAACNPGQTQQEEQEPAEQQEEETEEPEVEVELDEEEEIVEVEINNGEEDVPPEPALSEWCLAGSTYDLSTEEGSIASDIIGIETYKGKEYCKGQQVTNINGMEISTTYYFTYAGKDMWVISEVAGQTSEVHITND